jgi:transposase
MLRLMLSEHLWPKLMPLLMSSGIYQTDHLRMTLEAILWRLRCGAPWRDLPAEFGPWQTVYNQFNRWSIAGHWQRIFSMIRYEIDDEWNFMDSTFIKVHQHATGSREALPQAMGVSRGGNTTKVHMLCDAHGNPIDFELTGGDVHDVARAETLIDHSKAEMLIGDKGYDSDSVRDKAREKGICPIIPTRSNSHRPNPDFDKYLYRHRHLIENLFARLKHFRGFATRYDKLTRNYKAVVLIACLLIWLKL